MARTIINGNDLSDWLDDDGAYDYYEEDIIEGYAAGCAHCGGFDNGDGDYDYKAYADGAGITLEDCNGVDDLDDRTRAEYDDTINPLQKFVDDNIDACTEHIKNKTIHKFLADNVKLDEDGSDDYFEYILNRIDSLI